jgi:hypothetical protein
MMMMMMMMMMWAENIKASTTDSLGYFELEQYEPWSDEEFKIIRPKEAV